SFAQERLWFLHQLDPESDAYAIPAVFRLVGDLSPAALERALARIARRHETLRSSFEVEAGRPRLRIEEEVAISVPVVDLSRLGDRDLARESARLALADEARPFRLEEAPLLRVTLLRRAAEEHDLLFNLHHIAGDGWSMGVLAGELETFYRLETGLSAEAPAPLARSYGDYAAWQREWLEESPARAQLEYWRGRLAGGTPLELPLDRPRPAEQTFVSGLVRLALPPEMTARVHRLGQAHGATAFMVLAAAWSALLGAVTGQRDVALGTPVANRGRRETEDLIGLFMNTLVLRTAPERELSFEEHLDHLRGVALEAFAHQELPFEKVVDELAPQRSLSRSPLFQVLFSLQNARRGGLRLTGLEVEQRPVEREPAKFELMLTVEESPSGFDARLIYNSDLFDRTTARRLVEGFGRIVEAAVEDPGCRLGDLPLLSPAQRHQLALEWGKAPAAAPLEGGWKPLHEQVASWAESRSSAPALGWQRGSERESWTYGELTRRVSDLGTLLREAGVKPGDRVGLCLERGPEVVAATLATFAAGGVFVPLDPGYPAERLRFMVEDSGTRLVLTEEALQERLPEEVSCRLLDGSDAERAEAAERGSCFVPAVLGPESPAYMIYTSGTTG
ncbi:MAG: AMP-binding protein, partial [Acidobacteria bacterium]|nr:AMP-binding protein [Acidobacteriota bacterium]